MMTGIVVAVGWLALQIPDVETAFVIANRRVTFTVPARSHSAIQFAPAFPTMTRIAVVAVSSALVVQRVVVENVNAQPIENCVPESIRSAIQLVLTPILTKTIAVAVEASVRQLPDVEMGDVFQQRPD
jgi:hypothetical protein